MSDRQNITEQIFEAALELAPGDRGAFLDGKCGGDSALRLRVETLLREDDQAGSFLRNSPLDLLDRDALDIAVLDIQETHPEIPDDATLGFINAKRPSPAGRLPPGLVLEERFTIIRFIAKGGMGEVYEAEDRYLQGVHVALKTILPHIADDPASEDSFKREVLLAREVAHPNLCPIYDVFYCKEPPPGSLFLSMKLLPGKTLGARLREGTPIPPEEALAILRQMAAGLDAIHRAGIVHRDIKSNNVMFDGSGSGIRLWITDFGLARTQDVDTTMTGRGGIAGTPAYMAPELFHGTPPSQASDLYAFGVVMHEVFTGSKPAMNADGTTVTVSPRLSSSTMPAFAVQLVKSCLDPDTKRRCDAFKEALETLALQPRKADTWTRRRFMGTAAAALCVTAGGTSWQWDRLENLFHPLPRKRFIALLSWPQVSSSQTAPMLTGVLGAVKTELMRFEAFDHNLFVISPEDLNQDVAHARHLAEVCDPLGANLVLAISCQEQAKDYKVSLRLLDPLTNESLRNKKVACPRSEITYLPERAALAAASLLSLQGLLRKNDKVGPGTQSNEAFTAFQAAETLRKEPNDKGLEPAIEKYKEAIDLDPEYALAHARLSEAYLRFYDTRHNGAALELARSNSRTALDLNPSLEDGHLALANVLYDSGDDSAALEQIAKALAVNPSSSRALYTKAQTYDRIGKWDEAENNYTLALRQRPNWWVVYNDLGYMLLEQGRYQDALDKFRVASLAAPRSVMALSNTGFACLQVGRFAEGMDYLKKCLLLDPTYDTAAANLSVALRYQGRYEEALPYALKASTLNPSDDKNWMELGDCYASLPYRQKEARDAYTRAAQEAENYLHTDGADGATWMRLAFYKVRIGNVREAVALMAKSETLGSADITSQILKARTLEAAGQRDDALNVLSSCFRKGATGYEIAVLPDLKLLRSDPRYRDISRGSPNPAPGTQRS